MKTKIILMTSILILLYACKEDDRGQYPVDSVAPGKVTSARVDENIAGGSIIVYDIPQEKDALYVRARYSLDNGTPMEIKSSVYTNSITIIGIGRSREIPVELTVVDRSQNESEPVTVIAHPFDSPIHPLADMMNIRADFGGIALRWENPTEESVSIDVFKIDDDNDMTQIERYYSMAQDGRANLRGQDTIETIFSVTVHDKWGNSTEPKSGRYTPWYEEKLDKTRFRSWAPLELPYVPQSGSVVTGLFDNNLGSQYSSMVEYITFDMGQVAKISRFSVNQRPETNLVYNFVSPKRFELWGSLTPEVTADFSTWQFIGYFESYKPSGLPLGQVTTEDIQYAAEEGEQFDVEDSPAVRYIRFQMIESWGQDTRIQYREMTLWGQVQK